MVLMYVRFLLFLRNVKDLLFEHGIDVCHDTIRSWWDRFGPLFAADLAASGSAPCPLRPLALLWETAPVGIDVPY